MSRVGLYLGMASKDVFRLWSATQLQVIIIAGICLPILLLLGLKNGHVADLREELATSPTGRQVIFWAARDGALLSDGVIENIRESVGNVDVIIPESQKLVFGSLVNDDSGEELTQPEEEVPITLYSTLPGDPLLVQFGVNEISGEQLEVVLSEATVKKLGVEVGSNLDVRVTRKLGADREEHFLEFKVIGVLPSREQGEGQTTGYAHIEILENLDRYTAGDAVAAWGIPAMSGRAASDVYESMLVFCFRGGGTELSTDDISFLESRGLEVQRLDEGPELDLFGTLSKGALDELVTYRLNRVSWEDPGITPIRDSTQLIVRNTQAEDDLALRWVDPVNVKINGVPHALVGLSLPTKRETGGWLNTYMEKTGRRFTFQQSVDNPCQILFPASSAMDGEAELLVETAGGAKIPLLNSTSAFVASLQDETGESAVPSNSPDVDDSVIAEDGGEGSQESAASTSADKLPQVVAGDDLASGGASSEMPVAIVPVTLLSFLEQLDSGLVKYDSGSRRFIDVPSPVDFTKARLYTDTIDDVPEAVEWLAEAKYAVLSESSRIAEIQEQDQSLQILVLVVALGVFVFGVITVFSVLVDSTDRKKGTIGILRVMGMSRFGVFSIVLFRAFVIGLLAAVLCIVFGFALAEFLRLDVADRGALGWKPTISVMINPIDALLIAFGALLCASLGAVVPALRASGLDPFDAITEGQFG